MVQLRLLVLLGVLTAVSITSFSIYNIESEKRELQDELIELSKVKYGLFSVDEWEEIISDIITKRVNDFNLEDTNQEELRERIITFLLSVVDELEDAYRENNSGTVAGIARVAGANLFNVFDHIKDESPQIADSILEFMNDEENREEIKLYLINKMNEYSEETFAEIDYSVYDQILKKHDANEKEDAISIIRTKIETKSDSRYPNSIALFSILIVLFFSITLVKDFSKTELSLLTLLCGILLCAGLLLPMISIDARISSMNFQLLGEQVSFTDQVLYYKSKSILEVVSLMILNTKPDVALVGFMVLLFSVLFPASKLLASVVVLYWEKAKDIKLVHFLVFKTAKWSMADVLVVAIFMAYIGFSGIISEQLKDIETIALNADVVTTNASSLQVGFFLFSAFALMSILVSHKLQYSYPSAQKMTPKRN